MTWHARTGPRTKQAAKFRPYTKMGTDKAAGGQYREWHYDLVTYQLGSGVRRTCYAVSISDSKQNRVEYLRDFSSVEQATAAAKEFIDQKLGLGLPRANAGEVGTIPSLPLVPTDQVPTTQEK